MPNTKPFYLAVRGVLQNTKGKYLLMQRASTCKHQPGFWEFPGGKVDSGEDFATALVREFQEETGFTVSLENIIMAGEWERENYKIAYLFLKVERLSGELTVSHEHDDAMWLTKEELAKANVTPQLENLRDHIVKNL